MRSTAPYTPDGSKGGATMPASGAAGTYARVLAARARRQAAMLNAGEFDEAFSALRSHCAELAARRDGASADGDHAAARTAARRLARAQGAMARLARQRHFHAS